MIEGREVRTRQKPSSQSVTHTWRCSLPFSSPQRTSNCGQTPMIERILSMLLGLLTDSPYTNASPNEAGRAPEDREEGGQGG